VHTCSGASQWTELHTLLPASVYELRVVAVNAIGKSAPSKTVVVETDEEVPEGTPMDVMGVENGSQALIITWKVGRNNDFTLRNKSLLFFETPFFH
jgi:hypothetical protein